MAMTFEDDWREQAPHAAHKNVASMRGALERLGFVIRDDLIPSAAEGKVTAAELKDGIKTICADVAKTDKDAGGRHAFVLVHSNGRHGAANPASGQPSCELACHPKDETLWADEMISGFSELSAAGEEELHCAALGTLVLQVCEDGDKPAESAPLSECWALWPTLPVPCFQLMTCCGFRESELKGAEGGSPFIMSLVEYLEAKADDADDGDDRVMESGEAMAKMLAFGTRTASAGLHRATIEPFLHLGSGKFVI